MKNLNLYVLLVLILSMATTVKAQSADEIIDKHITAIGGADNWRKVNSLFYEADLHVHGSVVKIYKTVLNGKGMRRNLVGGGPAAFEIYTPTEGWEFLPFQGQQIPESITPERLTKNADLYDAQGIFLDYKTKGHTIKYIGKETIDKKEYYKIQADQKGGKTETFYFDVTSYLIARSVNKEIVNGIEVENVTKYSDYQKLPEGILFPMSIALPFGESEVKKVEINKAVNANIFKLAN